MDGRQATRSFLELCAAFAKEGMPRPRGPPVVFGPPAPAARPLVDGPSSHSRPRAPSSPAAAAARPSVAERSPRLSSDDSSPLELEDDGVDIGGAATEDAYQLDEAPAEDEAEDAGESETSFRKRLRLQHRQNRASEVVRAERGHNQFRGGAGGQVWRLWIAAPRPILLRLVGSPL